MAWSGDLIAVPLNPAFKADELDVSSRRSSPVRSSPKGTTGAHRGAQRGRVRIWAVPPWSCGGRCVWWDCRQGEEVATEATRADDVALFLHTVDGGPAEVVPLTHANVVERRRTLTFAICLTPGSTGPWS